MQSWQGWQRSVQDHSRQPQCTKAKTSSRCLKARNVATAELLYEKLISVIFLKGDRSDWIPAASSSCPLTDLIESLVKKKFVLSRRERSKYLREVYYDGFTTKKQEYVPKMNAPEASRPDGDKQCIHVYRGRRFPIIQLLSEMSPVKNWIRYALEREYLNMTTFSEVYQVFRQTFNMYRNVNGKKLYLGYPVATVPNQQTATAEISPVQRADSTAPNHAQLSPANDRIGQNVPSSSTANGTEFERRNEALSATVHADLQEGDRKLITHTARMLDEAQNDRVFFLLCSIADETVTSMCGIYAACALERSVSELRTKPFIHDILEYSRGRYLGVRDSREHPARKNRIDMNVKVLKAARQMYNLHPYEAMNWNTASELIDRFDEPFIDLVDAPERERVQLGTGIAPARDLSQTINAETATASQSAE